MSDRTRIRIGRHTGLASRQNFYLTELGIEIDELDFYEVVRKRVLFEDVVLLTYHRETGWIVVTLAGLAALAFFIIGAVTQEHDTTTGIIFGLLGIIAALFAGMRVKRKIDVVTVFGRRSKAALRFFWRKRKAHDLHARLTEAIQTAQAKLAVELGPEPAAPIESEQYEMPPVETDLAVAPMPGDAPGADNG